MERKGFLFYRSFWDALKELDDGLRLTLYDAIAKFGLNGEEPQLTGIARVLWSLIVPQMEANNRRYENGCKGGAPTGNANAEKQPKNNQKTTKKQPKNNQDSTKKQPKDKEKEKDKDKDNIKEIENKRKRKEIVAAEAATLPIDGRRQKFYESLIPYVGRYGKEMIRAFFDYWSEENRSKTKMRYELQPTWEVGRRLAVWAKKETHGINNAGNREARTSDAAGAIADFLAD